MDANTRFIVIDDDALNNKICKSCIMKMFTEANVTTFTDPQQGFDFVANEYGDSNTDHDAILFLDINMPVMNGWEFLDLFDQLSDNIKSRIKIHMLSSSVDKRDMERAQTNKNVVYYHIKPLTKETVALITFAQKKK